MNAQPLIATGGLRVVKKGQTISSVGAASIETGERVGVIGPNGCGKSTLLRVFAGLERDFRGDCRIAVPPSERVYVHQSPYLFRGTVLSNVCYGLRARRVRRHRAEERARYWLGRLGMERLAGSRVRHLSGGERKRTALARALAVDPALLLLDEPLAELDDSGAAAVLDVLDELGQTVVIAAPAPLPDGCTDRTIPLGGRARDEEPETRRKGQPAVGPE